MAKIRNELKSRIRASGSSGILDGWIGKGWIGRHFVYVADLFFSVQHHDSFVGPPRMRNFGAKFKLS